MAGKFGANNQYMYNVFAIGRKFEGEGTACDNKAFMRG